MKHTLPQGVFLVTFPAILVAFNWWNESYVPPVMKAGEIKTVLEGAYVANPKQFFAKEFYGGLLHLHFGCGRNDEYTEYTLNYGPGVSGVWVEWRRPALNYSIVFSDSAMNGFVDKMSGGPLKNSIQQQELHQKYAEALICLGEKIGINLRPTT